jgi:cell shape-determining protein MreD
MWLKYLAVIIAFYLATVLQSSFFVHYSLCNGNVGLFFILFFTLIYFSTQGGPGSGWGSVIFYSLAGGFIYDAMLNLYFGTSILGLLIVGLLTKKVKESLHKADKEYPLSYFLVMFIFAFLIFNVISATSVFTAPIIKTLICNIIFAIIFYFIYKRVVLKIDK